MKLRHILFYVVIIIIALLLIFQFGKIQNFASLLKQTHWWVLIFVVILRILYYWANTMYFKKFFAVFKRKLRLQPLFASTITLNFVNIAFPTAGLSGITYIRQQLNPDVKKSDSTLSQLVWYLLTGLSYVILLGIGFVLLLISNRVIHVSSRLMLVLVFVLLFIAIGSVIFLFNKGLTENITYFIVRPINWMLRHAHKRPYGKKRIEVFYNDLHHSIDFLRKNWPSLHKPFFYAFLMVVFDMASIYVVFLAFGQVINPGVVMTAYVIATLTSIAAIFTAGVGAYEAGMIAAFVGLGIPFDLAFSVTIVYRVIALWLFLPIGLLFYKHTTIDEARHKPRQLE
jgi:uncharacterized protein (TIRG00374 family)